MTGRVDVLGIPVDAVDMVQALEAVDRFVHVPGSRPAVVLAVNPEKACMVRNDERLGRFFGTADLLIPDGIGIVLAVRWLHRRRIGRVPGIDLMDRICAAAPGAGYRLFLFGGRDDVNARAVDVLRQRYPGIEIVGRENGYVPDAGTASLVERINMSRAHVLFVGLGSPRQERWIEEWLPLLDVKVCQGVGGSFDVLSGAVRRAPALWRRTGLEWLYRLTTEPRRARRQLRVARFAGEIVLARLRGAHSHRAGTAPRP